MIEYVLLLALTTPTRIHSSSLFSSFCKCKVCSKSQTFPLRDVVKFLCLSFKQLKLVIYVRSSNSAIVKISNKDLKVFFASVDKFWPGTFPSVLMTIITCTENDGVMIVTMDVSKRRLSCQPARGHQSVGPAGGVAQVTCQRARATNQRRHHCLRVTSSDRQQSWRRSAHSCEPNCKMPNDSSRKKTSN